MNVSKWLAKTFQLFLFNEEERINVLILLKITLISIILSFIWGILHHSFAIFYPSFFLITYGITSSLNVLVFYFIHSHSFFRKTQLCLLLSFPLITQFLFGGLHQANGIILCAFLAPISALMLYQKRANLLFVLFCIGIIFLGGYEIFFMKTHPKIPYHLSIVFFVFNIISICSSVFLVLRFFILENNNIKKVIVEKNKQISNFNYDLIMKTDEIIHKNETLNSLLDKYQASQDAFELEHLKAVEMNERLLDSLKYAQKIQHGLLPSRQEFITNFQSYSLLYLPKDVVSGDFYWFKKKGDSLYFAVADCTGHGVPAAFLSIIGTNGLNQAVLERKLKHPNEILNHLNNFVVDNINTHAVSEIEYLQDGLDISLCKYIPSENKIEFSGAYNPLYLLQNNELKIIKGDRLPIGNRIDELKDNTYTNHVIDVQKNDWIYLFSDGYVDQFCSNNLRRFKYVNFRKILLKIHTHSTEEQEKILLNRFYEWKGDEPQIDDISILGIQL